MKNKPIPQNPRLSLEERPSVAVSPVGEPEKQCWTDTISDPKIKEEHYGDVEGGTCVSLQSSVVETGKATFVFCCQKDANGKCKDCTVKVRLGVWQKTNSGAEIVVFKFVTVKCHP